MNLANSTMKKNFVPMLIFSIKAKLTMAFLKSDLCVVRTVLERSNETTKFSCGENVPVRSNGGCDLHPSKGPTFDKVLHLNDSQFNHSITDSLDTVFLALLLQLVGRSLTPGLLSC